MWPAGAVKKNEEKKNATLTRTLQQLWLMFRFGTGDTVVAAVGIADSSRTKYNVGI